MIVKVRLSGLCPCDPRIYRFPAAPVQGRRIATTPEARRPASAGLGPGIGARVASLRCPILRPVSISLRQLLRSRFLIEMQMG
jgi:hypothetical protein